MVHSNLWYHSRESARAEGEATEAGVNNASDPYRKRDDTPSPNQRSGKPSSTRIRRVSRNYPSSRPLFTLPLHDLRLRRVALCPRHRNRTAVKTWAKCMITNHWNLNRIPAVIARLAKWMITKHLDRIPRSTGPPLPPGTATPAKLWNPPLMASQCTESKFRTTKVSSRLCCLSTLASLSGLRPRAVSLV